jgi:hypothetical protein
VSSPVLPLALLMTALLVASAGCAALAVTRRGGPGAVVGAVVLGGAGVAVGLLSLVPVLTGR